MGAGHYHGHRFAQVSRCTPHDIRSTPGLLALGGWLHSSRPTPVHIDRREKGNSHDDGRQGIVST